MGNNLKDFISNKAQCFITNEICLVYVTRTAKLCTIYAIVILINQVKNNEKKNVLFVIKDIS